MSIHFFSEEVSFSINNEEKHKDWIQNTIREEGKSPGEINIVFCSDDYLHSINVQYLDHDTYTDIITFDYSEDLISGELFISVDRVKENSESLGTDFIDELDRVIIHGVLHLVGYNDKTEKEKSLIRKKEDRCLSLRTF